MKRLLICLGLLIPVSAGAEDFPKRKPGLWEIRTSIPGHGPAQTMKQCIDAASDAKLAQMGKSMGKNMGAQCAKNEFRKEDGKFISESDCTAGGTRMISKSVFSGDFNSRYTSETTTRYDPPMMGTKEQKMTLSARWVGPCEAGQKPGDVILPSGMKMNINSMRTLGGSGKK